MKTLENCRIQISSGLVRRFYSKIGKREDNECWTWKASKNSSGYGWIRINYRLFLAHRVSWEIHSGVIPEGKLILHKCNNRSCVNPQHLYVGDHTDNAQDVNKLKLSRHGVKAVKPYDIMKANSTPTQLSVKGAKIIEREIRARQQLVKEMGNVSRAQRLHIADQNQEHQVGNSSQTPANKGRAVHGQEHARKNNN